MIPLRNFREILSSWTSVSPSRRLILETAWRQKRRLIWVLFLGTLAAGLEGCTFFFLAVALELLATTGSLQSERLAPYCLGWIATWGSDRQFVVLVASAVICQVCKSFFQVMNTQISNLLSVQVAQDVQQEALTTILDLNFSEASRHKIGELTNFVVVPAESVANVLINGLNLLTNFLTVLAYVFVLCVISLPLFLAALFLFSGVVWLQKLVGKKIGFLSYTMGMQQADLSRKVVEGIGGLRLVHAFHRQDLIKEQVAILQNRFISTMRQLNLRLSLLGPLSESLLLIGLGGFLLVGFFLFKNNRANLLPDLLTFIAVLNRLSSKVTQLSIGWSTIRAFASRVSVLNEVLGTEPCKLTRKTGFELDSFKSSICFEDISLRYPGRTEEALKNINLEIEKGTSLALVGPSGSGKSTLADLLLGLYEPSSGKIKVDGYDLKEISMRSWRNQLGVVSQDTLLFNATVKDNLLFAKPDANSDELHEALQSADALEFISSLPQSLDTLIGERGFMLSGGQRQRLAIARALLRKPSILILDEATSALDTNAEQAVQETLDSLPSGGTRLIIAHRLSTIKNADKIAVLDQGRVVESGSHDELISTKGLYWQLWQKQTGNQAQIVSESCNGNAGKKIGVG